LLHASGKDATQDFEEIGHSNSARDLLEKYIIGAYAVSNPRAQACMDRITQAETKFILQGGDSAPHSANSGAAAGKSVGAGARVFNILLPLLLILAAVLVNLYLSGQQK
jgi:hypothetical protein